MSPVRTLPVRLSLPGTSRVDRDGVFVDSFRLYGVLQARGRELHLEWSGVRSIAQTGTVTRSVEEPVPVTAVVIPLDRVARVRLRGRWWRPRLEIWPAAREALAAIPGGHKECLVLRFAHRDWTLAAELCSNVELEQADAALKEAEQLRELPPGSLDAG